MGLARSVVAALTALVVASPVALAQAEPAGPEADLSMAMQAPASTPLVGSAFQLVFTITNHGPEVATGAVFSQYVPPELELVSTSSSDAGDDCTPGDEGDATTAAPPPPPPTTAPESGTADGSTGSAAPGYYRDAVNCTLGSMAVGETSAITLDLRRIGARETYSSAWVGSSLMDSNYDDNYADLYFEADTSDPADVALAIDVPGSPDVGADFDYTLSVTNNGPSVADSVTLFNPAGYGLSFVSVSASRPADVCRVNDYSTPEDRAPEYAGYSEVYCDLTAIDPGQTVEVTVTATRVSAYEIWNSASVQTTNYDGNYENDYAYFTIAADPSVTSDLDVDMTAPSPAPLVGTQFDLTIAVTNHGPAASGDTWLSNYLPTGLEFVSASESCSFNDWGPYPMADAPASAPSPESGDAYYPVSLGGVYCSIGSVASGATATVTVTVTRTAAREIWNSAWVSSSNHDPNYDNNYSDLLLGPDTSNPADVSVAMSAPAKPDVGANFPFTIEVTNNGPSVANDVAMTNFLPFEVEFRAVSSDDPSDTCEFNDSTYPPPLGTEPAPAFSPYYGAREVRCDLGSLEPGQTTMVTVDVTRTSEYEIWNSAWVATSNYDEDYENDYASVLVEGEPYPGACPAAGGGLEGSASPDSIVVGNCYAETKGGADSITVVPPSTGSSSVDSGAGPDSINVNLAVGATSRRTIKVRSGRGRDVVRIAVAPGAGNALIEVFAGRGNDTIQIDAPAGVKSLRIVVYGGDGNDTVAWTSASDAVGANFPSVRAFGGAGTDLLHGGYGHDRLNGGPGGDRLYGNLGDDVMRGGFGYDVCRGGPGDNTSSGC
ncbi:MAG: hypothetical protein ACRDKT_00440 [Actinomycetota bacterium]